MDLIHSLNGSPWIHKKFDNEAIAYLTEGINPSHYRRNEIIINSVTENNDVYLVTSGVAQVELIHLDGNIKTVMIATAGNIIAEVSAVLDKPTFISSSSLEEVTLYKIPWPVFKEKLENNIDILWDFVEQSTLKKHILINQIEMLSFGKPLDRVKKVLYWMFTNQGEITKDGGKSVIWILSSKITHQDIADITGLSRVSVSNSFRILYDENIIVKKDGYLIIRSLDKLG